VDGKTVYLEQRLSGDYKTLDGLFISSVRFDLIVEDDVGKPLETFEKLSMHSFDLLYFPKIVSSSALIDVEWKDRPVIPGKLYDMPKDSVQALSGGGDEVPGEPKEFGAALDALEKVEDASILAVPGECSADIYDKLIGHCYKMKYRVAILDPKQGLNVGGIRDQRANEMSSMQGYGALYYPWLKIVDPVTKDIISVPPSGAIAGVYARTDTTRGVHKAPANEGLIGVVGLDEQITTEQQALLNPSGINVIRFFKGSGYLVWGARTISNDASWRYVNVRRHSIYL
jgi:phage tail sheath protein FI